MATSPTTTMASVSKVVATGRRMKGREMFSMERSLWFGPARCGVLGASQRAGAGAGAGAGVPTVSAALAA